MNLDDRIVREAEDFLRSFTRSDLQYRDAVTVHSSLEVDDEYVCVATFGAADELTGENDEPEGWPIRLRVHNNDGDEAEVYLAIADADAVCKALRAAMRRARSYPQPQDRSPSGG